MIRWTVFAFLLISLFGIAVCQAAGLQYETITVANTTIGFTASKITAPVSEAVCTLETAQIRFRVDGTDPTSSEGHLLETGQKWSSVNAVEIGNFRAIRTGGVSGVLKCSYR